MNQRLDGPSRGIGRLVEEGPGKRSAATFDSMATEDSPPSGPAIDSSGPDTVYGTPGDDTLYGEAGNDTIYNGTGSDVVYGGDGDDRLIGDYASTTYDAGTGTLKTHADVLYGGAGNDTVSRGNGDILEDAYYGGSGSDTIMYVGSLGNDAHWDLANDALKTYHDRGVPLDWHVIEIWDDFENYINTTINSHERVTGTDESNFIQTGTGNNSIAGLGGDDEIIAGGGADEVDGGAGNDSIDAGAGADTIRGGAGDDIIVAGGGHDSVSGDAGADTIFGGAGTDHVDYSASSAGVTVVLGGVVAGFGGDAAGDLVSAVEIVTGSNFNDVIFGDAAANTLFGAGGSDVLAGGAGMDAIHGGAGYDVLSGADGGAGQADRLFGGADTDIAYYYTATTALVVDFSDHSNLATNSGEHTLDTWDSIEGFYGANAHSNTVIGDGQDNLFLGGNQADLLFGGGGSDILTGRDGADVIYGGDGADYISGDGGDDVIYGGSGSDIFYIFATSGTDTIKDFDPFAAGLDAGLDGFVFYQTGATRWSDLTTIQLGDDVEIGFSGGSFSVVVENVDVVDLNAIAGSFLFF